jgi:hypothetical protein
MNSRAAPGPSGMELLEKKELRRRSCSGHLAIRKKTIARQD